MKKNKSKSVGELLKILWQEDFFAKAKELSEISGGLAAKGYHYRLSTINVALVRSIKSDAFLTRMQAKGKWKYIQKHPIISPSGQRIELFQKYDFHPKIKDVSFKQFEDGYYKEAIQNALVEVIDQVKIKARHPKNTSGRELDGDDLMNRVFGCDNQRPKIKFNSLRTSLDKAEQRGIMYLFKGVVGIRDKKAHLNFVQNDPLKTVEYLSLASLLLRLLDDHKRMK